MELANATDGQYPSVATVNANPNDYIAATKGNTLTYHTNPSQDTYCISAVGSDNISYVISNLSGPYTGSCIGTSNEVATEGTGVPPVMAVDGTTLQTITTATCPTANKIRAVDARDSHTYWVQKLADGKCWMLTNLGYAGGGTNTYGDIKSITNSNVQDYTKAYYMIPTGSNVTTEPTNPSTSTDGGATNPQYGYLYNWCAAMGAPISTDPNPSSACANATTPAPDTSRSICPSGWRLPVGNGAEFTALNNAVNSGSTSSDAGLINTPWLGQRSGYLSSGFNSQGTTGYYWSSTQYSATSGYGLYFLAANVGPANGDKSLGFAIRCVAAV